MIGFLTVGRALLAAILLVAGSVLGAVKGGPNHEAATYEADIAGIGPISPGSFHVIAVGDTAQGHLVVYTVLRPGRTGLGLGDILTDIPNRFHLSLREGNESYARPYNNIRYDVLSPDGHATHAVYGQVTTPGVAVIKIWTVDGGTHYVSVQQPGGGFIFSVPADDAGAEITPVRG